MHLVTDISQIKKHYKENHVVKVRVFGTIADFNAMEGTITIQSLNLFSKAANGVIKLSLDLELSITNPEITYFGTLVDIYGLYDGEKIVLVDVRFPDNDSIVNNEAISVLQQMSEL